MAVVLTVNHVGIASRVDLESDFIRMEELEHLTVNFIAELSN